jgi:UDP-N-acetylmuramoyl-tripeptide--D-alanyl-D-alanine ligase
MMPDEIRRAVRGRWLWPAERVAAGGVCTDSRTAGAGEVFFALRGERFDGHDFLAQAADAGCTTAVIDQQAAPHESVLRRFIGGVIGVGDTTAALGDLAAVVREHLAATVVGVTGSNGKTTVKRMIDHILSRRLNGSAAVRSFNNAVGVPLTIFGAEAEDDYLICEVGTSGPGEIAGLSRIVRPDVAVITSVSEAHLARLIDLEHVAAEKAALLGGLRPHGVGVIRADSEPLQRAVRPYEARLIRFGEDPSAELRLTGYEVDGEGCRFELNGRRWFRLGVPGRHNALNALAAIATAQRFGLEQDEAGEILGEYEGAEMRLQQVRAGELTIINDAYNANPASMLAAAEVLTSVPGKRHLLVAGGMLEMGESAERLHRDVGSALARAGVDIVVGVGEMGGWIADGADAAGGCDVRRFADVEEAERKLPRIVAAGDVVLVKGSRGIRMERLIEPLAAAGGGAAP